MHERREQVRLQVPVLIEYPHPETWKTERSFTHDISLTGIRFPTEVKFQVGQELLLTLELPFEYTTFQATGEIVWIREIARLGATQYDVGVRFRWMEDLSRQRLDRTLRSFWPAKV